MTDHERGIEAAKKAFYQNMDPGLGVEAAISAYLATTEPGKPESGVLAEAKDEPTQLGEEERSRLRRRIYDDLATDGGGTWATYVCIDISALERAAFEAGKSTALHAEPCEPVAWMFEGKGWGREVLLSEQEALERKERLSRTWDITITPLYSSPAPSLGVDIEEVKAIRSMLGEALQVLDVYADPTGYTDGYGEILAAAAEVHEGLMAKETAAKIRAILSKTDGGFMPKFALRDRVSKKSGSSWHGHVVGFYSTELTPIGYCVESEREPGSVQIYPEAALSGGADE